jgi:hypothetical protein
MCLISNFPSCHRCDIAYGEGSSPPNAQINFFLHILQFLVLFFFFRPFLKWLKVFTFLQKVKKTWVIVKTNYIIMKGSVRLRNNVPMTALLIHAVAQWVECTVQWANYRSKTDVLGSPLKAPTAPTAPNERQQRQQSANSASRAPTAPTERQQSANSANISNKCHLIYKMS